MTKHRSPRPLPGALLVILTVVAIAAGGCSSVASPQGWASPVQDGDLLLAAHRDELFALDAADLAVRWSFPPAGNDEIDPVALYGTPAFMGEEMVLVPTYDGVLYALERESGNLRWQYDTGDALIGGVAVSEAGDAAYFGSANGNVYALDAEGVPIWSAPFETDEPVWSTPSLAGDTLFVTSLDRRVYAIAVETGAQRWEFKADAGIGSTPVVAGGSVFVGAFDSQLRALGETSPYERWSVKADNWFWSRPLEAAGTVYAGSLDGRVYAIDAATGEERWPPFDAGGPIRAAPALVGEVLFVVDTDGNIHGIDTETGAAAFAAPFAIGDEVLADLLVRESPGETEPPELVIVTTAGNLVRVDPVDLRQIAITELGG